MRTERGRAMIRYAEWILRFRRAVVWIVVSLLLLSGLWGLGVFDRLNLAGYADPNSDSAEVERLIGDAFGRQAADVVVIYTAPDGQTVDDIGPQVRESLGSIDRDSLTKSPESYWTSMPVVADSLVSADHTKALAILTLAGDESERLADYPAVVDAAQVAGVQTAFAGWNATTVAYNEQSEHDLVRAEAVAIPITLVLLVFVFGGVVAALIPLAVGGLAVFGSLGALRALSYATDVSAFAVNMASILGLGIAIDYGLFLVTRFREETRSGLDPIAAAQRALVTAGRTIAFSALLLVCGFAGMMVYPIPMLRSLGYGAMIAVALAALVSVTAVPAVLALLGGRVDAWSWRRVSVTRAEERSKVLWTRLADFVIARPWTIALVVVGVLAVLAAPAFGLKLGSLDVSGLPVGNPAREAQTLVTDQFPDAGNGAVVIVRGDGGSPANPADVNAVTESMRSLEDVSSVDQIVAGPDFTVLRATLTSSDFSIGSADAIAAIRTLDFPDDVTVLVGGENALEADSTDAILHGFPLMVLVMVTATLVLMFLAFRSVVLPIKAVLMAFLSLAATFGILTWLFQNSARAEFLGITGGPLPAAAIIMIVAVVFGLSTDYEVFLMSRMVEAHDSGADTPGAVRIGLSSTGRVITSAALLLLIVTGAAALSAVNLMKIAGLGMAIAIAIDATIIRMLLVPALVTLMGAANWWNPLRSRRKELTPVE
ncbi:MMPL family transporter [Aldersonia sp. NBC_00410]|uniref:MMPL family transporter n=1 Tax=Aldersonia sp. NBC_00410 TaxID=2975954 RepID=UPI00224E4DDE|nr:MMPL family transporter [Aldersonia sp. NBC_00410]MCX5041639.1 MMPL family transporter [Aldersonia sp. NBC_00410]